MSSALPSNYFAQLSQFDQRLYSSLFQELYNANQIPGASEADILSEIDNSAGGDIAQRDIKLQARYGEYVIHRASAHGWIKLLQVLFREDVALKYKGSLARSDDRGLTPLLHACKLGHAETILFLLDNGASATDRTTDHATSILNYLVDLRRDANGRLVMLPDVAHKLVRAGASPNARPIEYQRLTGAVNGTLDPINWDQVVRRRTLTPLGYAIWMGDLEVVKCLLQVGAIPDVFCFHLAAGLHQIEILGCLLSHRSYSLPGLFEYNLGDDTLLDAVLRLSTVCSTQRRLMATRITPPRSIERMVEYLLSQQGPPFSPADPSHGQASMLHVCRNTEAGLFNHQTLGKLVETLWPRNPPDHWLTEALTTAVIWNNTGVVDFLLGGRYKISEAMQAEALHACAAYPEILSMGRKLIEKHSINMNLGHPNKTVTDLELPIQIAVACQNFEFANYLVEHGADREQLISPTNGRLHEKSLLGWLIQITWSESQHRIRYLFEEYPQEAVPDFIVMPQIGRTALQQVACQTPANEWNEQDTREMMRYLIDKYPGSRHLEYQRIDRAGNVRGNTSGAGYIYKIIDGKTTVVKNDFHFKNPIKDYPETKEKEHNGMALHHAVRAINLPAVEVLLEAGADASAMIGHPLPDTISVTRKPASTYAVKENIWASTVLDFALLVKDRLEAGVFPESITDRSPSTLAYLKRRSADIVELLTSKGGSHSVTFVGRRGEEKIYKERREKGNIAALKLFTREVRTGLHQSKIVAKQAYKDAMEDAREVSREAGMPKQEVVDNDLAMDMHRQGRLKEAAALLEKALASNERQPGGKYDNLTFIICLNLACVYSDQNRQEEAKALNRRALEGFELTSEGADGRLTMNAAHNLGAILADEGNLEEAEPLYVRALHGRKKVLGPEDSATLQTLANLASVYSRKGKFDAAEEAFGRALKGQEKALGTEDRIVLFTVQSMGHHYQRHDRHDEAKAMTKRAIAGREKVLGPQHFDTLTSIHALAEVLKVTGEQEEAAAYYEHAVRGFQEALGPEHRSTTSSAYNLGLVYVKLGRQAEACHMFELTLHGEEKRLGPDHGDTLLTAFKLAGAYKNREEHAEAERLYLRVLAARETSFGPDDSLVRDSNYNLGIIYHGLQRLDESASALERALFGEEAALGHDHNDTLYTAFELAKVYKKQNRWDEAQTLFIRAMTGREKSVGAGDSAVRNSRYNLGVIYVKQGSLNEAANMFEGALMGEEQALGRDNLDTLCTVSYLGEVYRKLKRYSESEQSYCRVLAGREAQLGPDSKPALDTAYNIGLLYKAMEKYDDAASNFRRALEGYEKLLGLTDSETLQAADEVVDMLDESGQREAALELCSMTLQRRQETLGENHAGTRESVQRLSRLMEPQQKTKPATSIPDPTTQASPVSAPPVGAPSSHAPPLYSAPVQQHQQEPFNNDIAQLVAAFSREVTIPPPTVTKWDEKNIQRVLSSEIGVDMRDGSGLTPLLWAAEQRNATTTQQLVAMGADLDSIDRGGRAALHFAAQNDDSALVSLLLSRGAHAAARDTKGSTPLHAATNANALEAMRVLLLAPHPNGSAATWMEAENSDGYTAFHLAAKIGSAAAAKILLEYGARLSMMSGRRGVTALQLAAELGHAEVLRELLTGAPPSNNDADSLSAVGMAALHYAAVRGHAASIMVLLTQGHASVDVRCPANEWTPLFFALAKGHEAAALALLVAGADMDTVDADGTPIIHVLARLDAAQGIRVLIEHGVDIESRSGAGVGATPLFAATSSPPVTGDSGVPACEALLLLLECGADIGARDSSGSSALHCAVGRVDGNDVAAAAVAQLLVAFGADVNARDAEGRTPLHRAAGEGREACVRLLLESGGDVGVKDNAGLTPLQLAATRSQAAVMTLLILRPGH